MATSSEQKLRRINIGCGLTPAEGWINADAYPTPHADTTFDCQESWPFPADYFDEVQAIHVLEHLPHFKDFFNHAWKALKPTGRMHLRLPYGGHITAMGDVDHQRPWYPMSFAFLQPGYSDAVRNAQHGEQNRFWVIDNVSVLVTGSAMLRLLSIPLIGSKVMDNIEWFPQCLAELMVWLRPIKSQDAWLEFKEQRSSNFIPLNYVSYGMNVGGGFLELKTLRSLHVGFQ